MAATDLAISSILSPGNSTLSSSLIHQIQDTGQNSLLATDEHHPLPYNKAFNIDAEFSEDSIITVTAVIADKYTMYKDKFKFTVDGATVSSVQFPVALIKKDNFFGVVESYKNTALIKIILKKPTSNIKLTVNYQGCWDGGVCYPPNSKSFSFTNIQKIPIPPSKNYGSISIEVLLLILMMLAATTYSIYKGFFTTSNKP